jgi:hypothetical protein
LAAARFKTKLRPTRALTAAERHYWDMVVGSWPANHFIASDAILLTQLCAACVVFDRAEDVNAMDKAARLTVTLATKLRITVQSRYDEKAVARQAGYGRSNEALETSDLIASPSDYEALN